MKGKYVFSDAITGEFAFAVNSESVLEAIDKMNWLADVTLTITQIVHFLPGSEDDVDHVSWLCKGTRLGSKVFDYSIVRVEIGIDH